MTITEINHPFTGETFKRIDFDNGFRCFIIPKKRSSVYAVIGVDFGADDIIFERPDGSAVVFPEGTAHFLEHKMFSMRDGDAFEKYALVGGDANAYTATDRTCYLFNSTECFTENLEILLSHVSDAYITPESVEKEKGIIAEEVKMDTDDPAYRVHLDMKKMLFGDTPYSSSPAGTVESVMSITPEILDEARSSAYTPENMILCIYGDVDEKTVIDSVNRVYVTRKSNGYKRIDTIPRETPEKHKTVSYADVAVQLFSIGFKFPSPSEKDGMKEFAALEVIYGLMFGKSTEFYRKCYEKGLFETFSGPYQSERKAFYAEINGKSEHPEKFFRAVRRRVKYLLKKGFDKTDFEREKKSVYSEIIYDYDSSDETADDLVSFMFDGDDVFEYPKLVSELTLEYTESVMRRLFSEKRMCLAIIKPKRV